MKINYIYQMKSKDQSSQVQLINFIRENSSFSRREIMKQLISGNIKVNQHIATDANQLLHDTDDVYIKDILIKKQLLRYYKFNKPINVISTFQDPSNRRDLSYFINKYRLPKTLRPCGRLDRYSSGLLLFSNDIL